MRIDASGNVLVGTTDVDLGYTDGDTGFVASANGTVQCARDSSFATLYVQKLNNDGNLIEFNKDGLTVGSIGTEGGDLTIGTGDVGLKFNDGASLISPWDTTANAPEDGLFDLGYANGRFKNLYLSGGAYLGGTGAANKLDDYEEGTWTPVLTRVSAPSITYTVEEANYTKIGRMVTVQMGLLITGITSQGGSVTYVDGLPFNSGGVAYSSTGSVGMNSGFASECHVCQIGGNSDNTINFHADDISFANLQTDFTNSGRIYCSLTYEAS